MTVGDGDPGDRPEDTGGDDSEAESEDLLFQRPWLPPDDRLWRHPSEMFPVTSGDPTARRGGHRWPVAVSAGVVGAMLATGVVAATGHLSTHGNDGAASGITTAVSAPTATVRTSHSSVALSGMMAASASVLAMAQRLDPSMVALEVTSTHGDRRGSGLVYRSDGVIITTQRLIDSATNITVVSDSGQEVAASVVGQDPVTDVAVLRVDEHGLPAVTLDASDPPQPGQLAVAVTTGGREGDLPSIYIGTVRYVDEEVTLSGGSSLFGAIETDAPLSSDVEGGALLDSAGRLVGMTAGSSGSVGNVRCYATDAATAKSAADEIISTGRVAHGWLGVEGSDQPAPPGAAPSGVQVVAVDKSSPAAAAGVQPGDRISSVDMKPVESVSDLQDDIHLLKPGTTVAVEVWHGNSARVVSAVLADQP